MIAINRRRVMGNESGGSPTWQSYVQDGLVFQLDGVEKGAIDGTWVDLIGGMVFTQADGTVTPVSNGWYFDGTCRMTNASIINYGENTTLEVCMSNFMLFHSGSWAKDNVYLYPLGKSIFFLQRESPVIVDNNSTLLNSPFTASFNLDQCHINKVLYNQYGSVNFFSDSNNTDIGYYRNQYTTGTVYAIRIYNRRLTAQEQLANQDVDIKRFGI